MDREESEPVTFLKPGMEVQVIGNCVMVKTDCEDDAIILAQTLIQISGKNVLIEEGDDA